jgi:hypothetical protein
VGSNCKDKFLFLHTFSLLSLLLFPCSFPVTISGRKPLTPVFTSGWTRLSRSEEQNSLYFSLLTGICRRDGFAGDCVLRQTVVPSRELFFDSTQKRPVSGIFAMLVRPGNRMDSMGINTAFLSSGHPVDKSTGVRLDQDVILACSNRLRCIPMRCGM